MSARMHKGRLAAVPRYLGQDFDHTAPGHRFYLYAKLWQPDWTLCEEEGNGTTRKSARVAELAAISRLTLNEASRPNPNIALVNALVERQQWLAESILRQPGRRILQLPARAVAPVATGLGMEHPLENGFAFLTPYGLPYLPGSSIKGVVRAAARELASGAFPDLDPAGWDEQAIDALFGPPVADGEAEDAKRRQGALRFWDAFPLPPMNGSLLMAEIMTPHQAHYYMQNEPPHDSGSPVPIPFLAIAPGARFEFVVECDLRRLREHRETLVDGERWRQLLQAAFEHAFKWLGFGAKTAVGYGAMETDTLELQQRERAARKAQERAAREERERAEQEARAARLAAIEDPLLRELEQLLEERPNKDEPDYVFLIPQLESGRFAGNEARVAEEIKKRMEAAGRWNPEGKGSKPAQRKAHQYTLRVLKHLKE